MKIFLSWSGDESRQLAEIFKEWLPNVLQYVQPYMSSKDISLGERWNDNINGNLEESVYGLVFVTPNNINAPWINFEAGALSKTLNSKVVPVLYNSEIMLLNEGPLKQFQSAKNIDEESILSLLKSINDSNDVFKLEEKRLEKAFEMWWPALREAVNNIEPEQGNNGVNQIEPTEKELLNVIYLKLKEQEQILSKRVNRSDIPPGLISDIESAYEIMKICYKEFKGGPYDEDFVTQIEKGIKQLNRAFKYLANSNRHFRTRDKNMVLNRKEE